MRSRQRTETLWISKPVILIRPGEIAPVARDRDKPSGAEARYRRKDRRSRTRVRVTRASYISLLSCAAAKPAELLGGGTGVWFGPERHERGRETCKINESAPPSRYLKYVKSLLP